MALSFTFAIRWLFLIVFIASVFTAFRLALSQDGQDTLRRIHVIQNPKFQLARIMKNETVPATDAMHTSANELLKDAGKAFEASPPLPDHSNEYSVQIFYYPWYGNPEFDGGKYYHWNHRYLPHWDPNILETYPTGSHIPPSDIGSNFYPFLGPYSSRDPAIIEQHMKWMSSAGIDVVIVSWYPPRTADEQGHSWDDLIPFLLDAVERYRMKLSFHMEPYKSRSAESLRADIQYIIDSYGNHSALYRVKRSKSYKMNGQENNDETYLPLLYFYDSYLVPSDEWKKLTTLTGKSTVRNSKYDILFIGLLVDSKDRYSLLDAGFDGIYTYFASEGFSYGSNSSNWPSLSAFCRKNGLFFIPSVGPGYDDRRVRPWNEVNYKGRMNGKYYAKMFDMAHVARVNIVTITSFNEWHEGTQIEPARPYTDNSTGFVYSTYDQGPEQYLHQTLDLIKKYFTPLDRIAPEKIVSVV